LAPSRNQGVFTTVFGISFCRPRKWRQKTLVYHHCFLPLIFNPLWFLYVFVCVEEGTQPSMDCFVNLWDSCFGHSLMLPLLLPMTLVYASSRHKGSQEYKKRTLLIICPKKVCVCVGLSWIPGWGGCWISNSSQNMPQKLITKPFCSVLKSGPSIFIL